MKLASLSTIAARRVVIALLVAFVLSAVFPQIGMAQGISDVGTWRLNLAKSKYNPGPAPKSGTLIVEPEGQGLKATAEGVDAQGKPTKAEFVVIFDGNSHPVTGVPAYDASSYKRINDFTMEYTRTKNGNVIQTGTRVFSTDGKAATFTTKGVNANGQPINNVAVYERRGR